MAMILAERTRAQQGHPTMALALQTAGMLSALIFLISSVYEVFVINHLYGSQRFLISLLLLILALWAFLEVSLLRGWRSRPGSQPLTLLLGLQLGWIAARHGHALWSHRGGAGWSSTPMASPVFDEAVLFLPIALVLFLVISRCLLESFAAGERLRANQLQEQIQLVRQTERDLQISEARYRNFFNLPLVGTAIASRSLAWLAVNDQTCQLLNYSREELLATCLDRLTHPQDRAIVEAQFARLLRGEADGFQLEIRFIQKDRSIIHTLVAGGCGPLNHDQPDCFHLNIIDIRDHKRMEADLRAAQERQLLLEQQQRIQLEQKLKTSLSAAAVAHEIQQPLSAILLNCRSAGHWLSQLPEDAGSAGLRHCLSQLGHDGDQVVRTMERMRMLLRNVETAHSPLDLRTSVESGLLYLKNDIAAQQVRLDREGLDGPCLISGDGAQLQIALVNLIRNALQAMQAQPVSDRHLLVQLARRPDRLELTVADSGPGFPAGFHNDTSWELLKSTKASGMGIGLFIATTAATNHRGQLHIGRSSRLGGAEVVIELPMA